MEGGNDVVDNINVGVVNYVYFGFLILYLGYKYYVIVIGIYLFIYLFVYDVICVFLKMLNFFLGYDFVGRKVSKIFEFVIVDFMFFVIIDELIKFRIG